MSVDEPTVLHADVDSFFASVEQRDDPRLRGRPVIVGGGVVLAASYEAKAFGIHSAMGGGRARQLCPQAIVVPPRMEAYSQASKSMFEVFNDTSPLVEGISIDEAFLDVRGMRAIAGSPLRIAAKLRRDVLERVGIQVTVGIARTKFLAKVASGVAKPDGLLLIPAHAELGFLHPLPVRRLWGVGPVTAGKLNALGIDTVGQVARLHEDILVGMLGRGSGRQIHALAHNRDARPVKRRTRRRSIGSQRALGRGPRSFAELDTILVGLIDRVSARLRSNDRTARTVVLRLRFGDYTRATRSHTLRRPTASSSELIAAARGLLVAARPLIERQGITLIGVSLTNLDDDSGQLVLGLDYPDVAALDATLDQLRDRFGEAAITRAVLLGRDPGTEMPTLPD